MVAGKEQDIAHRLDGAQVMGMQGHRQRAQEVVQGEAVAALPAHRGDIQLHHVSALLQCLATGVDQVAASG
ncbi:hypothetical protein D3C81_2227570 [compost metagenome]